MVTELSNISVNINLSVAIDWSIMQAEMASMDNLKHLIRTWPVIDNHGHNILRPQQLKAANFLTITTEANGEALEDTPTSLSHLRAVKQLRKLYDLPQDADWPAIQGKRIELLERDPDALMKKCFEGTQTILIDDGLDSGANIERYSWHDKCTLSPCIVRIETVAADILSSLHQQAKLPVGVAIADEEACGVAWVTFVAEFERAILSALEDDEVVGFKSVICYRTGLDITVGRDVEVTEDGLRSFSRHYLPECLARNFRVEAKGMNDALVISACKLIAAAHLQTGNAKPIQFHTGLGDNDISLLDSNPAYLQPLIKHFPTVPIVLLHSSYPYTREAGYLATVYKNVYLDIGEVFPMVSRDGQEKIVRQALELTSWSKMLWSTDGHHFPETYWLANVQGRAAIEKVLVGYVEYEDLTVNEAVAAAKGMLFENSNKLYHLGLSLPGSELSASAAEAKAVQADDDATSLLAASGATRSPSRDAAVTVAVAPGSATVTSPYDVKQLMSFMASHPSIGFIIVQWLDYLGQLRSRILPTISFRTLIANGSRIGISKGNLGTLQNDHVTPVCDPVGGISVEPDLSSLRLLQHGLDEDDGTGPSLRVRTSTATVLARFVNDEAHEPLKLCPKSQLEDLVGTLKTEHDVELLVGFEIEVTFCKRRHRANAAHGEDEDPFEPLDTYHAWGTLSDEQVQKGLPLVTMIAEKLQRRGIEVQQLHSEAGAGQYEFVLPPLPPVQAVDTLVQTRQIIQLLAAGQGMRATFHPMPFPGIGTAAHAHISLNSSSKSAQELEKLEMSFFASLLEHLPALCAFTMPQAVSYCRVVDDSWTGGTWVAWGTQNREVPLRRVGTTKVGSGSRWEVRCLDGLANMYLALGAIVGAGLAGIRDNAVMTWKDCTVNPTKLSNEEKTGLGIVRRMPRGLEEAIEALEKDEALKRALSEGVVEHYLAMKNAEQEMLNEMEEKVRRVWMIERY